MTTAADLARNLKAKRSGPGWIARCPAHEDHRESLSIGEGEAGRLLLNCFAGCSFDQIIRAAGVQPTRQNGHDQGKRQIVATYDYRDARGELVFQVVRFAPKDFRQRRPDGNGGGWIWNLNGIERVPYRLPEIVNASEIYICEGEKDCDRLAALGVVATTNPGGADTDGKAGRKWPESFGRWFRGRHVVLIPDNDESGRRHVQAVAQKLSGHAASIRVLELPGLPPKGDVSDWLAAGGTVARLVELANDAPRWQREDDQDGELQGAVGLTEDELAAEFTHRHRDHYRYIAAWGAWMRWTGEHWQREATLEAFDLARAVCRDAADRIHDLKARARILSAATRAAVENLARSDRAHAAVTEQWDCDPFTLHEPRRTT
jgi:putative DNA primase/helicase